MAKSLKQTPAPAETKAPAAVPATEATAKEKKAPFGGFKKERNPETVALENKVRDGIVAALTANPNGLGTDELMTAIFSTVEPDEKETLSKLIRRIARTVATSEKVNEKSMKKIYKLNK